MLIVPELSDELFTGIKSSLVQGSVLNLSYEFVYGSQFTHHGQVSVSITHSGGGALHSPYVRCTDVRSSVPGACAGALQGGGGSGGVPGKFFKK